MSEDKVNLLRAVRDMALADGRLEEREEEVLDLIARAEGVEGEDRSKLVIGGPMKLDELPGHFPERADRVKVLELSALVAIADGVESPAETERLTELATVLELSRGEVLEAVERAHERFFELSKKHVP